MFAAAVCSQQSINLCVLFLLQDRTGTLVCLCLLMFPAPLYLPSAPYKSLSLLITLTSGDDASDDGVMVSMMLWITSRPHPRK